MKKENLLPWFLCCDIISTLYFLFFGEGAAHELLKIVYTVIIGMAGGFAGLAGKALFRFCTAWVTAWYKRRKSKPPFKN